MKRVILESPFAGDEARNRAYAQEAMLDALRRGEAPMVSHLLYTQVLRDHLHEERALGIAAGHAWMQAADACVIYTDLGVSSGMQIGFNLAEKYGLKIERRSLWQK